MIRLDGGAGVDGIACVLRKPVRPVHSGARFFPAGQRELDRSLGLEALPNLATEYKELDRESQVFHQVLKPYLTDCVGYLTHTAT